MLCWYAHTSSNITPELKSAKISLILGLFQVKGLVLGRLIFKSKP